MPDGIFFPFHLSHGCLVHMADEAFPSRLSCWRDGSLELNDEGTHFGFLHDAPATLDAPTGSFHLQPNMYFSVPFACRIKGPGQGIVITRLGYRGVFTVGGPIEPTGRLRYIDGCTDSLLLPPQMSGDPCLNALYFPAGISQTQHTHPSARIGLVVRGAGECSYPSGILLALPSPRLRDSCQWAA
jgi:hypothetical protein